MRPEKQKAFTLLEIMIVVAVIGIVVSIAAPTWIRQREISRSTSCQENLSKIEGSVEQYALEYKLGEGAAVNYPDDLLQPGGVALGQGYLKSEPKCPASGEYAIAAVGDDPICSIGAGTAPFAPHELQ